MAQDLLPDRPHILTLSLDRRFPNPKGFWFTSSSSPLQYMTYLSAAQRGILLTRASYDMHDEPDNAPVSMTLKPPAKDTVKKKLSAKDYLSRKKSDSPTENDVPSKASARPIKSTDAKKDRPDPPKKEEPPRLKEKEKAPPSARPEGRVEKPRQELDGDRYAAPPSLATGCAKTSRRAHCATNANSENRSKNQLPPRSEPLAGSSTSKKRIIDPDDSLHPQKRPKPDVSTPRDSIRASKPETPRSREPTHERSISRDLKPDRLHPTVNGRSHKELDRERDNTASPRSTIQVNGAKSHTSTPRKVDAAKVPALLSPLHPSFDRELDDRERTRKKVPEKMPTKKSDLPPAKKSKMIKMPELLSPTLPPIVEAELARTKLTPTPEDSSQRSSEAYESPNSSKKAKIPDEEEPPPPPSRPSRIVTLKLRKGAAKRAKDLLSLPSKSLKEALKKERSMSVEGTPPPARKRPRIADELLADGPHIKRSRTAAEALKSVATPSTPLKHSSTAMTRVASSQSQGNTPGAFQGLTPSAADRPPTSSDNNAPHLDSSKARAKVEHLRERHEDFRLLGGKLKHTRDDLTRERGANMTTAEQKRAAALHFEMILSYMISFNAFNQSRVIERKVSDLNFWESLLPHMRELKSRVRHSSPLMALAAQMHAVCLEEISHAYATLDPASAASCLPKWSNLERSRAPVWEEAMRRSDEVEARNMKVLVGPWTNVDDAVASALSIMCRWAERENVTWRPSPKMYSHMGDHKEKRTTNGS